MLRDELLRSKNDEIARCLSSRKRKLSELYFATVGFAGATGDSPEAELNRQKEAAFLNANDITQGRFYDEDTLPKQREIPIKWPAKDRVAHPEDVSTQTDNIKGHAKDESAADRSREPSSAQDQQDGFVESPARPANGPTPDASQQHQTLPLSAPGLSDSNFSVPTGSPGKEERVSRVASSVQDAPVPQENRLPPPQPQHPPDSSQDTAANTSLPVVSHGAPVKHQNGVSPASSGPSSSHTFASEASPKSSSTEDSLVPPLDTSQPVKTKGGTHSQAGGLDMATSNKVPATPDEQLKLEAAMFYQSTPDAPKQIPQEPDEGQPSQAPDDSTQVLPESRSPPLPQATQETAATDTQLMKAPSNIAQEDTAHRTKSPAAKPEPISDAVEEEPEADVVSGMSSKMLDVVQPTDVSSSVPSDVPAPSRQQSQPDDRVPLLSRRKQKEESRNRLSTVIFPKERSPGKGGGGRLVRRGSSADSFSEEKDYLHALFQAKAHYPPRSLHLSNLLSTAHKTLTTSNHFIEYEEQMSCRTLKRIYQLQNANKWPLRQLTRASEPQRSASHWDVLLDHVKWMSTDFKEERRWKIAAAKSCADWCADYVASDEEGRSMLRVKAKRPSSKGSEINVKQMASPSNEEYPDALQEDTRTPDLVPSLDDDLMSEGFNDDLPSDVDNCISPAAIFSLGSDDFTFRMERTPASDKILEELPICGPVGISSETGLPESTLLPDAVWRQDLLPVSKFANASLELENVEPPRKRSRYDYSGEEDDEEDANKTVPIPPDQQDIALFQPENKHIRDRIHPGHSFRPPTEYAMPSLGFYESRQSSQWTYAEDDELRRLVREYSYNWSLISSCLSPQSRFASGTDRRTPWECFERWIGLEGLPADMAKTPYFRAYSARLEAAQRTVLAAQQQAAQQQQQQQQQQSGNNPTTQGLARRRTTQPLRVDRKRTTRHLALLAGMRKLTQKREALLQKQQHASHLASLRKANEANQPRPPFSSPAEFSRLKYEREVKYQERSEQYRQHIISQQRAAYAQRMGMPQANQQQMANGVQGRNALPANGTGQPVPGGVQGVPNGLPANGTVGPGRSNTQGVPNGVPGNGPMAGASMPMKSMSQTGTQQPAMTGRPAPPSQGSPDNARVIREANRVQEQQRLVQSRQQHQFHTQQPFVQGAHSSPNMNMPNPSSNHTASSLLASFQASSGAGSPSFHAPALAQGASNASPRMTQPNPLSNPPAMPNMNTLQHPMPRNNPNLAPEQASKLANERFQHYQQQQQQQQHRMSQAAMNAAAGNIGSMPPNYQMSADPNAPNAPQVTQPGVPNGGPTIQASQTQGYSPLMRVTQAGQQNRMGVNGSPAMSGMVMQQSRNTTPQPHRTPSGQGGSSNGPGKSPRPPQAQTAGN